jgi:uncharacterized protein (TIGR02284 family)
MIMTTVLSTTPSTTPSSTITAHDVTVDQQDAALLNDLLQLNLDSQNGYKTAADALRNKDYAERFHQYAQERQQNADELTQLLRANGHTGSKAGTLSGLFHQGWLNLEALLAAGDAALLADCERADALILSAYQDVMGKTTNEGLLDLLRRQFTVIRDAHDYVKTLRGALEQAVR